MKAKVELIRRILRMLYEMLFTVLLMQFIHIVLLKYEISVVAVSAIVIVYVLSYIIRDVVYSYGIIAVLHIILGIIPVVLPLKIGTTILLILLVGHIMFDAIEYGIRGNKLKILDDFPWPTFVFSFIVYLYGRGMDSAQLEKISYVIPLMLLMLYYVMIYTDGVREYVDSTKDVTGLPLKRIIGTNTVLVGIILFVIALAIFIGGFIDFDSIIKVIYNGIVYIIRLFAFGLSFIFRLISMLVSGEGAGTMEVTESLNMPDQNEYGKVGLLSDKFILEVLFVVFLLYVSYLIVSRIIKRLMMFRVYEGDIVEKTETNKKNRDHKIKPRSIFAFKLSNEEKVRKYYRLRILREKYDIRLSYDKTCREIEEELKEKGLGDVSAITDLYASVRYGGCVPDKKMVNQVNNLSKQ